MLADQKCHVGVVPVQDVDVHPAALLGRLGYRVDLHPREQLLDEVGDGVGLLFDVDLVVTSFGHG